MLKNKEVKKFIFIELIILLISIFIITIISNINYLNMKKEVLNFNNYVIENIVKNHPELKEEIINNYLTDDFNSNRDYISEYGLTKLYNLKNHQIVTNIICIILLITILFISFLIFINKQYKKIRLINKYMHNILNDNYNLDIREYDEGDISNLKNDLYKVTTKLKNSAESSKKDKIYLEQTLSDISHQIKTPLTSMYVINDLLSSDNTDKKLKKELLIKNKTQLERIEWLVSSLLKMSRLDSGSTKLNIEKINILKLINESLEPINIPIELKKINIKLDIDSNLTLNCDFKWTREALINIIKNAYEHTNEFGNIEINAKKNPLYTEITITDDGIGIDKENIQLIFKRFYKGDNKESIGIGLNMAKMIIEKQNGFISCESEKNKYTKFIIKFYNKNI